MAVLPIVFYEHQTLRKQAVVIDPSFADIDVLVNNLFDTMYNAQGVGLAAPQIGLSKQIFVVDADALSKIENEEICGPMVFINPKVEFVDDDMIELSEGCLSIPDISEIVVRPRTILVTYMDQKFKSHTRQFSGWVSRVIQHEYDHLNGILFIDHISTLRRTLLSSKLKAIRKGKIKTDYDYQLENDI